MKLPVLKAERTSDMYIDYEMVRMSKADSLPIYHEKRVSAENYVQEVCSGFVSAYQFYLSDRVRVEEMIAPFWQSDTRYLIRHTQQYAMYLSSALHPMFMRSIEEHMLMLQLLQKNKSDTDVIKEELSALINMDTPLFSCKASAYIEWYQNSAYETHQHLIKKLGADDLREQLELIKLSMKMMDIDSLQMLIQNHFNQNVGQDFIQELVHIFIQCRCFLGLKETKSICSALRKRLESFRKCMSMIANMTYFQVMQEQSYHLQRIMRLRMTKRRWSWQ